MTTDIFNPTNWLRAERQAVRTDAQDAVARARMAMIYQPMMTQNRAISVERLPEPSSQRSAGYRGSPVITSVLQPLAAQPPPPEPPSEPKPPPLLPTPYGGTQPWPMMLPLIKTSLR